jgi:hypothetical protein
MTAPPATTELEALQGTARRLGLEHGSLRPRRCGLHDHRAVHVGTSAPEADRRATPESRRSPRRGRPVGMTDRRPPSPRSAAPTFRLFIAGARVDATGGDLRASTRPTDASSSGASRLAPRPTRDGDQGRRNGLPGLAGHQPGRGEVMFRFAELMGRHKERLARR